MKTHLSLFSGIGGLDLAAEWAGFTTVGQCEWADYPTKVLEKHWPDVPRWRDIRTLTKESFYAKTGRHTVDIISGGFPCQPFSVAGKQKGKEDDRYLWPEMLRVIRELKPGWVVGENVDGLLSSKFREVLKNIIHGLETAGYYVRVFSYEAAQVEAPHRRRRTFIVANSNDIYIKELFLSDSTKTCDRYKNKRERCENWIGINMGTKTIALLQGKHEQRIEPLICRMDYGFSHAMDRNKCLGNAVVPQQAYPIFQAIAHGMQEEL